MRPLIKEASIEQKYKMLKLIKEATQLDELNLFGKKVISKDKLPQKSQPTSAEDDYRSYFKKPGPTKPTGPVYHGLDDYYSQTKADPLATKEEQVNELRDETIQSYLSKADRQISNRQNRMSQARERLNKNYEIYDVNNPTKIIDKFEANTPELAREYYYKFIKEFNPGDQDFHFEVRRSTGLSEQGVAEDNVNEAVDIQTLDTNFKHQMKFGRYIYIATGSKGANTYKSKGYDSGEDSPGLSIEVFDPYNRSENPIAYARFIAHRDKGGEHWLESDMTRVEPDYRGQNIAYQIYAYAKMLGNDIKKNTDTDGELNQTELGKKMWRGWGKDNLNLYPDGWGKLIKEIDAENLMREDKEPKIADAVIGFYKPVVSDIHKEKIDDYVEQARELMHKAPNNNVREKLLDIFKKGKTNPYLQGGIITTVGALLAGGVLSSSQNLGLNPAQTNLALQAILNTVIPTIVSRVNGKNWIDTIKYTLASAGVGTGIAGVGLVEENPNQQMALYKPDGKTYRGSHNKMPTLDDPEDIYNKGERYDFDDTADLPDELVDEPNMDDSIKELIKSKLDELEPRERKVLQLRYWHDMTAADIADRLNVSQSRILQIEARAMRKIKTATLDFNPDTLRSYVPESKDYLEEK
jgi:RNA polymerase sigma factor (sigma-70 family)